MCARDLLAFIRNRGGRSISDILTVYIRNGNRQQAAEKDQWMKVVVVKCHIHSPMMIQVMIWWTLSIHIVQHVQFPRILLLKLYSFFFSLHTFVLECKFVSLIIINRQIIFRIRLFMGSYVIKNIISWRNLYCLMSQARTFLFCKWCHLKPATVVVAEALQRKQFHKYTFNSTVPKYWLCTTYVGGWYKACRYQCINFISSSSSTTISCTQKA